MLNLALLYCGCPRTHIREMASQLLYSLYQRFLAQDSTLLKADPDQVLLSACTHLHSPIAACYDVMSLMQVDCSQELEDVMMSAYHRGQLSLSRELSRLHPELTIQLFSGNVSSGSLVM